MSQEIISCLCGKVCDKEKGFCEECTEYMKRHQRYESYEGPGKCVCGGGEDGCLFEYIVFKDDPTKRWRSGKEVDAEELLSGKNWHCSCGTRHVQNAMNS